MEKYAPSNSWGREKGSFPRIEATYVYQITPESITGKAGVLPALEERWPAKNNTLSPQWGKRDSAQGPETVLLTPADETGKPIEVAEWERAMATAPKSWTLFWLLALAISIANGINIAYS